MFFGIYVKIHSIHPILNIFRILLHIILYGLNKMQSKVSS